MSDLRQTRLVAAREMRERGRSSAFLASLLLMLIGVAAAIVLPAILDAGPGTKDIGLTGTVSAELADAVRAQGDAVDITIRIHDYDDVTAAERALRDGDVDVVVVVVADATRLEWLKRTDEQLKAVVIGAIQVVAMRDRAANLGISDDELAAIAEPVPVTNVELGQVAGRSADDETAAFIMTLVLFGAISTYGAMVLSGVVEEKSSRTVEVLLARMPPRNLLAGKIAGIGLLGLAQIAATATVALIAGALVDSFDVPAARGSVIAWTVVWFLLGYTLYATVFGSLGSLASRTEDASSVAGPITIVLVLAFMVSFATIGSVDTTWARLVAWFPLTAPLAMPNRIAMGAATWWDPVIASALTLAAIAGLVALGGRVYTRAILHTGATLSLGDAWRGAATTRVGGTAQTATSPPKEPSSTDIEAGQHQTLTQLLAIVLGVISGTAVFALAHDFVIGVGVGAAVYAVALRVTKARAERLAGRTDASHDHDRETVGR